MHLQKHGGRRKGRKRQGGCCGMCLVRVQGIIGCMILHSRPDREGGVLTVAESKREVGANCEEKERV